MKIRKLLPYALLIGYALPIIGCGGPKTCTITFDPNNGEATWTITAKQGAFIAEPDKPEKTAYTFKNWKHKGIAWGFAYNKVQEDMTLIASYKATTYTAYFDPVGGYLSDSSKEVKYTIETTDPLPVPGNYPQFFDKWIDEDENVFDKYEGHYGNYQLTATYTSEDDVTRTFGKYAQSIVTDSELESTLKGLRPSSTYEGYLEYEGERYYTHKSSDSVRVGEKYFSNGSYSFFKFEDLKWFKLADLDDNKSLYTTEFAIFCGVFGDSANYKNSRVRDWMLNDFYENAFSDSEKEKISPYKFTTTNGDALEDKVFAISRDEFDLYKSNLKKYKKYSLDFSSGLETHLAASVYWHSSGDGAREYCSPCYTRDTYNSNVVYAISVTGVSFSTFGISSRAVYRPCIVIDTSK